MVKRKGGDEPPIRKSFLITGGVALATALIGFVLMNFVLGGGDEEPVEEPLTVTSPVPGIGTPAPTAAAEPVAYRLKEGGRNPFEPAAPGTVDNSTPPPQAEEGAEGAGADPVKLRLVAVSGDTADIKIGRRTHRGVKVGTPIDSRFALVEIKDSCVTMREYGESFDLCEGVVVER